VSYALYGFVRKITRAGALEAVTIETGVSLVIALPVVGWYAWTGSGVGGGSSMAASWDMAGLLMLGGVFTAIPLLFFGYAAQRLSLSAMGFAQFMMPHPAPPPTPPRRRRQHYLPFMDTLQVADLHAYS